MENDNGGLSHNTKKSLAIHLGESAATEIAEQIARMAAEIEELKRSKVSVTPVVPGPKREDPMAALENENF